MCKPQYTQCDGAAELPHRIVRIYPIHVPLAGAYELVIRLIDLNLLDILGILEQL